ncbi:MAG: hypothetical protein FJ104_13235, partial [Deltaproteobacteria bacterium]|nr:hypothetical protein [Deltaproteobacteria bacterium]
VNVLVVLDKSGSMQDPLPGTSDAKWDTMKAAVGAALDGTKGAISYGLALFPQAADGQPAIPLTCADFGTCCGDPAAGVSVDVAPGATAVPLIEAALDATTPGGATPSAAALSAALDYFTKGAGKDLAGDRYVLFATDGGPNCDDAATCAADSCTTNLDGKCSLTSLPDGGDANCCDAAFDGKWRCLDASGAEASVTALASAGIPTFVVGIPGSEAYSSTLDALALAGGVPAGAADGGAPRYFAVSASGGAAALTDVLESITKSLIKSCRLELANDPPDRTLLNVEVDGVAIARGAANGWELDTKTSPPTVVLQGTTCARVETEGATSISVVYGCPTVE